VLCVLGVFWKSEFFERSILCFSWVSSVLEIGFVL
jgi:hypothetical protein